jgi:SMODS and SLOG-associating 2TM effector domain family 4
MFDLSLVDTLRLAFGQVVYHHKSHSRAASSLARWSRWFRAGETILMTGVVIAALGASFGSSHAYAVASAVMASLALLTFLIHVTFDFESTARAHHVCSTRLWSIREQYRGLLSDLNDRAIDPELARARRNVLMEEVTAVYESAPPMTRRIFKLPLNSTESAEELALADEEIDRFLPKSLHGAGKVAPAS